MSEKVFETTCFVSCLSVWIINSFHGAENRYKNFNIIVQSLQMSPSACSCIPWTNNKVSATLSSSISLNHYDE